MKFLPGVEKARKRNKIFNKLTNYSNEFQSLNAQYVLLIRILKVFIYYHEKIKYEYSITNKNYQIRFVYTEKSSNLIDSIFLSRETWQMRLYGHHKSLFNYEFGDDSIQISANLENPIAESTLEKIWFPIFETLKELPSKSPSLERSIHIP